MRHLSAAVWLVAGIALPVCAQRGGMGGGMHQGGGGGVRTVGPPVATFRGSVAAPAPHFNGGGLPPSSRFWGGISNFPNPNVGFGYNKGLYDGHNGHWQHEREEHREHRGGYYPGYYPGYYGGYYPGYYGNWVGLGYPGYLPFLSGFEDPPSTAYMNGTVYTNGAADPYGAAGPPPDQTGAAYGYPPAYSYGQPSGYAAQPAPAPPPVAQAMPNAPVQGFRPEYQPQAGTGTTTPAPAAEEQEEEPITLIFKDGRPSEHIHNYAMTRTTLYVQDKHHREIPLAELDLPATVKANREAGVSFDVPKGGQ